jgi:hypothetical protein
VSPDVCVVLAVELQTGAMSTAAFAGIDMDKVISLHNRNVYITYDVTGEDGTSELYMVQIKLEGLQFEMVLVP